MTCENVRKVLLIIVVLSLISINIEYALASHESARIFYSIVVDEDGSAKVKIEILAPVAGLKTWVAVPKRGFDISVEPFGAALTRVFQAYEPLSKQPYYFYDNLTVRFSRPGKLIVKYDFKYASLIYEPRAFFFSPLILYDPDILASLRVILNGAKEVNLRSGFASVEITPTGAVIDYALPATAGRVSVHYTLQRDSPEIIELDKGPFIGVTPSRYKDEMSNILNLYSKLYSMLSDFFNVNLKKVGVRFFVPKPGEENIEGYVPIERYEIGDIYLNIFYIRTIPGFFEVAAAHELIHQFLWEAGIRVDVLWFHEGAANFFSIFHLKQLGYDKVIMIEQDLLTSSEKLTDLGFLQSWSPERQPANAGIYYAAAYRVLYELNEKYGPSFFMDMFDKLSDKGIKIDSTEKLVSLMEEVKGEEVRAFFNSIGFRLRPALIADSVEVKGESGLIETLLTLTVVMLGIVIALLLMLLIRRRREREYVLPEDIIPGYTQN